MAQNIFQDAEAWVFIGVCLLFVILFFLRVPGAVAKALDERATKIRTSLNEAQALRQQALALLNKIQQKHDETEKQAEAIIATAQAEVERLEAKAEERLEAEITRRIALADQRIKIAEYEAVSLIKNKAANLTLQAADVLLLDRLDSLESDPLIVQALTEISKRLQ